MRASKRVFERNWSFMLTEMPSEGCNAQCRAVKVFVRVCFSLFLLKAFMQGRFCSRMVYYGLLCWR